MSTDMSQGARTEDRANSRKPSLRLVFSGDAGIVYQEPIALQSGEWTAGRQPGTDLSIVLLHDPLLSRKHAVFYVDVEGQKVQLKDLDSRNGSAVNGKPVGEQWLVDGDVIRLGDSFFILRWTETQQPDTPIDGLLGTAPNIKKMRHAVTQLGPSEDTVLLIGERGSGKETTARALHACSERTGPFIAVHCTTIPETTAESELFGTNTDAPGSNLGFFRSAEGGTLFLDGFDDLSPALQAKVLHAIEMRCLVPAGEEQPIPFDARLILTMNQQVDPTKYRGELYTRFGQQKIDLPSLRKRREDILALLDKHLSESAPPMSPDLVEALLIYPWPNNVRELVSVATELRVRGAGLDELVPELVVGRLGTTPPAPAEPADPTHLSLRKPMPSKADLQGLLHMHNGNIDHVAREVGRSRMQVYRWLKQYGLASEDDPQH